MVSFNVNNTNMKKEIKKIINECNCYNRDTGEWGGV